MRIDLKFLWISNRTQIKSPNKINFKSTICVFINTHLLSKLQNLGQFV